MSMPTQLGPSRVGVDAAQKSVTSKNVMLIIPIPTSETFVTLYCLGGLWLQGNGQLMPNCVSPKSTSKWQGFVQIYSIKNYPFNDKLGILEQSKKE
jgi:hypothetical protein